jgi:RNA-directed DNA polymerase
MSAIYTVCRGPRAKRIWALDADLAAAFDKIDRSRLLEALGSFPARDLIRDWLKAEVFETGKGFAPTEEGTPQGGGATRKAHVVSGSRWLEVRLMPGT